MADGDNSNSDVEVIQTFEQETHGISAVYDDEITLKFDGYFMTSDQLTKWTIGLQPGDITVQRVELVAPPRQRQRFDLDKTYEGKPIILVLGCTEPDVKFTWEPFVRKA